LFQTSFPLWTNATHVDELFSDVGPVVGIRVVGVHVLDGIEDPVRVESVVVLPVASGIKLIFPSHSRRGRIS
jgi:hypothetical protein